MARKKAAATPLANGGVDDEKPPAYDSSVVAEQSVTAATTRTPTPPKINVYNLTELKNTCDDTLKKHLSKPDSFQQQHFHTDIRLALGYSSTIIAAGSALYGWKADFAKSKPLVTLGVALYFILTALQTLYIYFVEGNTVFVGKRKTIDRRISTERLEVASKTAPSTPTTPPQYSLEVTYLHSANGGKALIKRGRETGRKGYNSFFDADGNMDVLIFETWIDSLVSKATSL